MSVDVEGIEIPKVSEGPLVEFVISGFGDSTTPVVGDAESFSELGTSQMMNLSKES